MANTNPMMDISRLIYEERWDVAKDPNTDPHVLERLLYFRCTTDIREAVVRNPSTRKSTLIQLFQAGWIWTCQLTPHVLTFEGWFSTKMDLRLRFFP